MKKVALVLLLAVVAPSLALAWLAVRSLRDQEYLLQRQQSLLYQGVADAVATESQSLLNSYEREFAAVVAQCWPATPLLRSRQRSTINCACVGRSPRSVSR